MAMVRYIVFFLAILMTIGSGCEVWAIADFAGQGKASGVYSPDKPVKVISWDDVWTEDPSRVFMVPGGRLSRSNKVTAAPTAKAKPEDKPDTDQPVKPDDTPEHKTKPDCKPDKKDRPKCRPEKKDRPLCHPEAKPDHKPSCGKPDRHKRECCKPAKSGDKSGCKPAGLRGQPTGHHHSDGRQGGLCGKSSAGNTGPSRGVGNGTGHAGHGKGGGRR